MAVRAQGAQVVSRVIPALSVNVIELEYQRLTIPDLSHSAVGTFPSLFFNYAPLPTAYSKFLKSTLVPK